MDKVEDTAVVLRRAENDFTLALFRVALCKKPADRLTDDEETLAEDFAHEVVIPMLDALLAHHNAVEAAKNQQAQAAAKSVELPATRADVWEPIENLFVYEVVAKTKQGIAPALGPIHQATFEDGIRAAFRNIRLAKALPE